MTCWHQTLRGRPANSTARDAALKCVLIWLALQQSVLATLGLSLFERLRDLYSVRERLRSGSQGKRARLSAPHGPIVPRQLHSICMTVIATRVDIPVLSLYPWHSQSGRMWGRHLREILAAIVVGYEVGVTVGAARTTYGSSGTYVVATAAALRNTP